MEEHSSSAASPPNFPKKLSGQISLYGKYLFLASCEAVELAKSLRLTHTLPFFVIFRADFDFAAQEKAVTYSIETTNGGHSFCISDSKLFCIEENREE